MCLPNGCFRTCLKIMHFLIKVNSLKSNVYSKPKIQVNECPFVEEHSLG